jgi:glutathione S-transferase
MYQLYYSPSSASTVVHAMFNELDVPFELVRVQLDAPTRDPAYLQLNPHGSVPTLVIDGQPMLESAAIVMTLAERHPEKGLAPAHKRALWQQWSVYLPIALGAAYRLWFYPSELGGTAIHSPEISAALQAKFAKVFDYIDGHLAANGPYLLGDTFSSADLQLMMYLRWSRNMPKPATEWPNLNKFAMMIAQRPSWKKVNEVEQLTDWL